MNTRTRGRPSRSALDNPISAEAGAAPAAALDRALRALYAAYEALRDDPTSSAPLAGLLRTPNWWRAAQQQLAAARAAMREARPLDSRSDDEATLNALAQALSAALLAAVLLRLPYDAWRPVGALLGGWQPSGTAQSALASPASECATLLTEIGVRCRLAERSPGSLVAICRRTLAT